MIVQYMRFIYIRFISRLMLTRGAIQDIILFISISDGGLTMKTKITTRKVDDLGRVVLPGEVRTALGIMTGSEMDIYSDGTEITLKKTVPFCVVCGTAEAELKAVKNKQICINCFSEIEK